MNKQEQKRACGLLDTQYGYIKEPEKYLTALSKPQQLAYYDGMKTIIEDLLLGTDLCLVRDENGKHTIESGKENTMELYYHRTDGGAEYYSTTYIECPNGHKEGTFDGVVMRTDGDEIEIFTDRLKEQHIKLVIN